MVAQVLPQTSTLLLVLALWLTWNDFGSARTATRRHTHTKTRQTPSRSSSGPSPSASDSASLRDTNTGNHTVSKTLSIPLPVQPAVITLVSSVVIDSSCIVSPDSTSENVACRTIVFKMVNDGFQYDGPGYHTSYTRYLLQPFDDSAQEPYGLEAQWSYISSNMQITTNVTHLTLVLPQVLGLALDTPSVMYAKFTNYYTLRQQDPQQPADFSIGVTATPTNIVSTNQNVIQVMTAVVAAASMAAPLDPAMLDLQSTIIIGSSVCTQAATRALAFNGRRALFPSIANTDPMGTGLWHAFVIMAIFCCLHLLAVYAVMQRYGCSFFDGAAKVYFPSMTLACALLLQPGIAYASFSLLFSPDTLPAYRMASIFTTVYSGLTIILPVTWVSKFVHDTTREHHRHLMEFPTLVRRMLPTTSWGPDSKAQPWSTPFGCCRQVGRRWVSLHLCVVTFYALVFAVSPDSPAGCSAQFFLGMLGCIAHCVILIRVRPYRATFFSVAAAINAVMLAVPLLVGFVHTFSISGNTGDVTSSLMSVVQLVSLLRALLGVIAHAIELVLIRPTIWPESDNGLVQAATVAQSTGVEGDQEMLVRTTTGGSGEKAADPVHEERSEDIAVYLQTLRETERARLLAEGHLEELRGLSREGREARQVLGPPDEMPPRIIPRPVFITTAAGSERFPILALHRRDGPLPPAIRHQYALEYERL